MIKFMMTSPDNGRKILGLIIIKENVDKLKSNEPIHFHCEQMTLPKIECHEIMIIYFETMELAVDYLKESGVLTDKTKMYHEPRTRQ